MEQLKLIAIKTPSKFYVSDNLKRESYFNSKLHQYLFDGQSLAKETNLNNWFELPNEPTKVEKVTPPKKTCVSFKLKAGYQPSDLMPESYTYEEFDDESAIAGLYERVYEETAEVREEVELVVDVVFESPVEVASKIYNGVSYPIFTQITTPRELLQFYPCELSGKALFDQVKAYVKTHTTCSDVFFEDYDWKFDVKKKIKLTEPYVWQENVNWGTKKKPKLVTRTSKTRDVYVLKISYDKGVCSMPPIKAESMTDLKDKFESIMSEIMKDINEQVIVCPCCDGVGVVLESEAEKWQK